MILIDFLEMSCSFNYNDIQPFLANIFLCIFMGHENL